jgi:hypothetical protein
MWHNVNSCDRGIGAKNPRWAQKPLDASECYYSGFFFTRGGMPFTRVGMSFTRVTMSFTRDGESYTRVFMPLTRGVMPFTRGGTRWG